MDTAGMDIATANTDRIASHTFIEGGRYDPNLISGGKYYEHISRKKFSGKNAGSRTGYCWTGYRL
jgi:hypothetical protein